MNNKKDLMDLMNSLPEWIAKPTCKIKAGKWIVWIVCGVVVKARSGKALLVLPELAYDLGGRID